MRLKLGEDYESIPLSKERPENLLRACITISTAYDSPAEIKTFRYGRRYVYLNETYKIPLKHVWWMKFFDPEIEKAFLNRTARPCNPKTA